MSQRFILGGRMGDLVHALYVVAHTPGGPHDLYITDRRDLHSDGFLYPLQQTIEELRPVLMWQDYVRSVQAYEGPVTEAIEGEWINLNMWRRKAYSDNWTVLLSKMFNVPVVEGAWMKAPTWPFPFGVAIHRSIQDARKGDWSKILIPSDAHFVGNDEEYAKFNQPLNRHCPQNLLELFMCIAGSESFIGNQSLPLAIACALDVPRIAVLNETDAKAYIGEEKIFKKFKYVL